MGYLIPMLLPLAMLWISYNLITGKSIAPAAMLRSVTSMLSRLLAWMWRERHPRSGGGRIGVPRIRYRQHQGERR